MRDARLNILVAESSEFSQKARDLLRQIGQVIMADLDRDDLIRAAVKADVLWVRLRHRIDSEIMECTPRLKIIVSPTTGLNHIDLEEAERRGIRILSLQGERDFLKEVRATAEHTLALMLSIMRHIPGAIAHVAEGGWNRELFKGCELYEKTVGIVGYGRLGQIVAKYLKAFDARVIVTDPSLEPDALEAGIAHLPLHDLLPRSDIVTLHANLTVKTNGFFGKKEINAMKDGAWFINTARGELLDEAALLDALRSGRLAGAALDVLANEESAGMSSHPIVQYARDHDNLIITPHIGGCTSESMEKTEVLMCARLLHAVNEDRAPITA